MVKVFLDPGHGGRDPGAVANGLQEKVLTLDIALKTKNYLLRDYAGVEVRLSREGDTDVTLQERVKMANAWGAHLYVSIHVNAGGGTGFESYVYTGARPETAAYRAAIHEEVVAATGFRDRGRKVADFYVLRHTAMPAVLTENGFIDSDDANRLRDAGFRELIARGHARGIARAIASALDLPQKLPFADVDPGAWYAQDVADLYEMGIVRGDPDGLFRPDQSLTRAEAARLVRLAIRYITGR